MFKGDIPGWEILLAIHDIERVNLNWLLSGEEHPYNVIGQQAGDEELLSTLDMLLKYHDDWHVYWINCRSRFCIALARNAERHTRDKRVMFTDIKLLGAGGGQALLRQLDILKSSMKILPLSVTGEAFHQLTTGEMSNHELIALIKESENIQPGLLPENGNFASFRGADPRQGKIDSLSHNVNRLNLKQRRLVRTLVTELLEQENKKWEEVY